MHPHMPTRQLDDAKLHFRSKRTACTFPPASSVRLSMLISSVPHETQEFSELKDLVHAQVRRAISAER